MDAREGCCFISWRHGKRLRDCKSLTKATSGIQAKQASSHNKITCPWISLHLLLLNPTEGSFSSLHCTKRKENGVKMFVNNYKGFYVLFPIVAKFYDRIQDFIL